MAYEIPQQLEYREKIMFGLDVKQLAYAILFFPLIVLIFFKNNMGFSARLIYSIILSTLGVGFIFLNLDYHLKAWYVWLKSRRIEKPEKLAKFIPIKEIKDSLIITNDKRKIAILKVEPINFSIKPDGSKEAITGMFQKLLNGLDFPVQILMNTESLDLKDYFLEVSKKVEKNGKFKELFEHYKQHLE